MTLPIRHMSTKDRKTFNIITNLWDRKWESQAVISLASALPFWKGSLLPLSPKLWPHRAGSALAVNSSHSHHNSTSHPLLFTLSVGQFWISRKVHGIEHIRPVAHIISFGHTAYILAFFLWATRRQATNCVDGNCHRYHDNTVAHSATSQTSSAASDRALNYLCFNFFPCKTELRKS